MRDEADVYQTVGRLNERFREYGTPFIIGADGENGYWSFCTNHLLPDGRSEVADIKNFRSTEEAYQYIRGIERRYEEGEYSGRA